MKWLAALVLTVWAGTISAKAGVTDAALNEIRFDQKLGASISKDLAFRDEDGKAVKLGDYLGRKPVILVLGYYQCPMLCTAVLNGMIGGLQDLKLEMGRDFTVVNVSINPQEKPELAAAKKQSYLVRYSRPGAAEGWYFLTGEQPAIAQLADEVGFKYAYDPDLRQYAHPSGLIFLTPDGKVSHYLFGVEFSGADLRQALTDSASAKVGSPIQQLFLLCFHYSPLTGKYSGLVMLSVRIMGIAVLLSLIVFIARKAA